MSQSLSVPERSYLPKIRNHRNAPGGAVRSRTNIWIDKRLFCALCVPLVLLRLKTDPRVLCWVQRRLLRIMVSPFHLKAASLDCARSFARRTPKVILRLTGDAPALRLLTR